MSFQAISSVETCHNFPVFWNFWVQLSLQHDLHLSILQNVGGGQFQRKICWFCNDVCFWSSFYDHFCILCESPLPWPGIHDHAGLCLGQEESLHQNELFWVAYIQCSLPSVGAARILSPLGQFCLSWSSRYFDINGHHIEYFLILPGMAVGHCYYFLEDIFPNQPGGWKILRTPQFLRLICDPAPEVSSRICVN